MPSFMDHCSHILKLYFGARVLFIVFKGLTKTWLKAVFNLLCSISPLALSAFVMHLSAAWLLSEFLLVHFNFQNLKKFCSNIFYRREVIIESLLRHFPETTVGVWSNSQSRPVQGAVSEPFAAYQPYRRKAAICVGFNIYSLCSLCVHEMRKTEVYFALVLYISWLVDKYRPARALCNF